VGKKIGECLIQAGIITPQDLQAALAEQGLTGERVGAILVRRSYASEKQMTKALAYQCGFAYVSLVENPPDPSAMALVQKDVALARVCVGARLDNTLLTVAISDPAAFTAPQALGVDSSYRIVYVVATRSEILECLEKGYRPNAGVKDSRQAAADFVSCPHGRDLVRGGCVSCARALEPDWSFCPFCAAPAEGLGSSSAM
jgi:type IV pilus assembly protein PilB